MGDPAIAYGPTSGVDELVTAAWRRSEEAPPVARDVLTGLVDQYSAMLAAGNVDGLTALFAEHAVRADPLGSIPNRGRDEIRDAFSRVLAAGPVTRTFVATELHTIHDSVAFNFVSTVRGPDGVRTVSGIDVFIVGPQDLIEVAIAYWGANDLRLADD